MLRRTRVKSLLVFASLLLGVALAAQNPPAPSTPDAHEHHAQAGMRQQHLQEMKGQVEQMRAALTQMKANAAAIKDSAAQKQAQLDADLWERMVAHLEGMINGMSAPENNGPAAMSGCAGMMGKDHATIPDGDKDGCCAGMGMGGMKAECCAGKNQAASAMSCCEGGRMSCGKSNPAHHDGLHEHDLGNSAPSTR
jgi:hypothetical protein